jgi:hypothetical protein
MSSANFRNASLKYLTRLAFCRKIGFSNVKIVRTAITRALGERWQDYSLGARACQGAHADDKPCAIFLPLPATQPLGAESDLPPPTVYAKIEL